MNCYSLCLPLRRRRGTVSKPVFVPENVPNVQLNDADLSPLGSVNAQAEPVSENRDRRLFSAVPTDDLFPFIVLISTRLARVIEDARGATTPIAIVTVDIDRQSGGQRYGTANSERARAST